ncbi:MAG: hypothetical protein JWO06_2760 [Bacteroidota bacterium]|nr:hypothetical protein [Bacteroidota bacterium]
MDYGHKLYLAYYIAPRLVGRCPKQVYMRNIEKTVSGKKLLKQQILICNFFSLNYFFQPTNIRQCAAISNGQCFILALTTK